MLLPIPPVYRRRPRTPRPKVLAKPLTLVGATYSAEPETTLTLVFDRAVSLAGLDGDAILVDDEQTVSFLLKATGGAELIDPVTVKLTLVIFSDPTGPGVLLTASPSNGIVALDDGGAWAGADDLALPFP